MSINLYIPSEWEITNRRMAGFWATAIDPRKDVSLYPIIEFTSEGDNPRFRVWDADHWEDLGLPANFSYDRWHTLSIKLDQLGGEVILSVGDLSYTIDEINQSVELGNVILQGYNTEEGVNYNIYWDDFFAQY